MTEEKKNQAEEEEEEEEEIPQLVPIETPSKKPKLEVSTIYLFYFIFTAARENSCHTCEYFN